VPLPAQDNNGKPQRMQVRLAISAAGGRGLHKVKEGRGESSRGGSGSKWEGKKVKKRGGTKLVNQERHTQGIGKETRTRRDKDPTRQPYLQYKRRGEPRERRTGQKPKETKATMRNMRCNRSEWPKEKR